MGTHSPKQEKSSSKAAAALTRGQADQLRRALETKREQLLRAHEQREEEREQAAELETGGDVEDVAEGVVEDRRRAALDEHDRALLQEIDHALAKFDAGTYGVCEATGRPIPFERLRAVPWARYDAEPAERAERAPR